MINSLRDIFTGIESYFKEQLKDLSISDSSKVSFNIKLAFKNERGEQSRQYPEATIGFVDYKRGNKRKYGGFDRTVETNPDDASGDTVLLKRIPIPVDLYFQLDIYSLTLDDDWVATQKLMQIFDSEFTIKTPADKTIRIKPFLFDNLDRMEKDVLFRKTFKFIVETWLDHHEAPTLSYLVKEMKININKNSYDVQLDT